MVSSSSLKFPVQDRFFKDRSVVLNLFFSLLVNFGFWLFVLSQARHADSIVPLHYTIYFGIDSVGPWFFRLATPAAGLLIILVNHAIAISLFRQERMLAYLLVWLTSVLQIILLVSGLLIDRLV